MGRREREREVKSGEGQRGRRGSGALEFVLVVVPALFLTTSVLEMSLASWQFHSMAYSIEVADRYACSHGRTCSKSTNNCTIQVKDVANAIIAQAPALSSSKLNVTLTTHAASVTCNPISSCTSNANQFPNSTDNGVGSDITITANYPVTNPIPMMWFGSSGNSGGGGTYSIGATTKGNIVY